ncbi:hypothetical protein DFS34DRAFT_634744 [Phlyctochytrium arcticum]|nr:hypothetical protein DFS34DRAFT_634744 [Phlyctochytrium arcticum]
MPGDGKNSSGDRLPQRINFAGTNVSRTRTGRSENTVSEVVRRLHTNLDQKYANVMLTPTVDRTVSAVAMKKAAAAAALAAAAEGADGKGALLENDGNIPVSPEPVKQKSQPEMISTPSIPRTVRTKIAGFEVADAAQDSQQQQQQQPPRRGKKAVGVAELAQMMGKSASARDELMQENKRNKSLDLLREVTSGRRGQLSVGLDQRQAPMTPSRKAALAARRVTRAFAQHQGAEGVEGQQAASGYPWPDVKSRKEMFEEEVKRVVNVERETTPERDSTGEEGDAPLTPTRRSRRLAREPPKPVIDPTVSSVQTAGKDNSDIPEAPSSEDSIQGPNPFDVDSDSIPSSNGQACPSTPPKSKLDDSVRHTPVRSTRKPKHTTHDVQEAGAKTAENSQDAEDNRASGEDLEDEELPPLPKTPSKSARKVRGSAAFLLDESKDTSPTRTPAPGRPLISGSAPGSPRHIKTPTRTSKRLAALTVGTAGRTPGVIRSQEDQQLLLGSDGEEEYELTMMTTTTATTLETMVTGSYVEAEETTTASVMKRKRGRSEEEEEETSDSHHNNSQSTPSSLTNNQVHATENATPEVGVPSRKRVRNTHRTLESTPAHKPAWLARRQSEIEEEEKLRKQQEADAAAEEQEQESSRARVRSRKAVTEVKVEKEDQDEAAIVATVDAPVLTEEQEEVSESLVSSSSAVSEVDEEDAMDVDTVNLPADLDRGIVGVVEEDLVADTDAEDAAAAEGGWLLSVFYKTARGLGLR